MIKKALLKRRSNRLRQQGNQARDRHRWLEAAEAYRRYLILRPGDAAIRIQMGNMYSEGGRHEEADEAFRIAARAVPADADLVLCWGHARIRAGDRDGAQRHYRRSAGMDGNQDATRALAAFIEEEADDGMSAPPAAPLPVVTETIELNLDGQESPGTEGDRADHSASASVGAIHKVVGRIVTGHLLAPDDADDAVEFSIGGQPVLALPLPAVPGARPFRAFLPVTGRTGVTARRRSDGAPLTNGRFAMAPAVPHLLQQGSSARIRLIKPVLHRSREVALIAATAGAPENQADLLEQVEALNGMGIEVVLVFRGDPPGTIGARLQTAIAGATATDTNVVSVAWARTLTFVPTLFGVDAIYLLDAASGRYVSDVASALRRNGIDRAVLGGFGSVGGRFAPAAIRLRQGALSVQAVQETLEQLAALTNTPDQTADMLDLLTRLAERHNGDGTGDLATDSSDADVMPLALEVLVDSTGSVDAWQHASINQALAAAGYGVRRATEPVSPAVEPADVAILLIGPGATVSDNSRCAAALRAAPIRVACWLPQADTLPIAFRDLAFARIIAMDETSTLAASFAFNHPIEIAPLPGPDRIKGGVSVLANVVAQAWLRPEQARAASTLRLRLDQGIPIEQVLPGPFLRPLVLDESGRGAAVPDEHGGHDLWYVVAPRGTLLAPHAADALAAAVLHHAHADIFYADDVAMVVDRERDRIRLKSAFDLTHLTAVDYVGAPIFVRADMLSRIGGLRAEAGTAASSDLLLRAHFAGAAIERLPEVLLAYPNRRVVATADDQQRMLSLHPQLGAFEMAEEPMRGGITLSRRWEDGHPRVTLIVPTARARTPDGATTYVERLLHSLARSDWPHDRLTVIVGDDQPGEPAWTRGHSFRVLRVETPRADGEPFNYAAKINMLWQLADDEHLILVNDDVEIVSPGWIGALLSLSTDPGVGGVGAKLLFDDDTIQHVGMAGLPRGATCHVGFRCVADDPGYQNWFDTPREWSMVTGAVFATRRSLLQQIGGMDERFALEFNDGDLCLRLRECGYRIAWTPHAVLRHAEKASRGAGRPSGKDLALWRQQWGQWLRQDPAWHPSLAGSANPTPVHDGQEWYL